MSLNISMSNERLQYIHKYKEINNINKIEIIKNYNNVNFNETLKDIQQDFNRQLDFIASDMLHRS